MALNLKLLNLLLNATVKNTWFTKITTSVRLQFWCVGVLQVVRIQKAHHTHYT